MQHAETLKKRVFKRCNGPKMRPIVNFIRKAKNIQGAEDDDHI